MKEFLNVNAQTPLLEVRDLRVRFRGRDADAATEVVHGVSFSLERGQTLAVVGESGSGKSVSALALTRLLPPPPVCEISGAVCYRGENLLALPDKRLRAVRGRRIAYVFQEPSTSLNPVFTVGWQIAEAVKTHFPERKHVREAVERIVVSAMERGQADRRLADPREIA